jgi:cytochrome c peroxidase
MEVAVHRSSIGIAIAFVGMLYLFAGCSTAPPQPAVVDAAKLKAFAPLPAVVASTGNPASAEKVALGRILYYEPRLSKSHQIACNTCHLLDKYGVDGQPTSDGHKGQVGERNAPTVYNAAGHLAQFWDGRAADVEEQAKGPVMNPIEMAMVSEENVLSVLKSMPEYVAAFKAAFPGEKDPVTFDNMAKAIGAFERGLTTPSRWDKFLSGDQNALTSDEKAGLNSYLEAGCQTCHAGAYVGGNLYQKVGLMKAWPDGSDPGREKVTKSEADRMVFKVPSLRNIAMTGPYYHNGKIATLEQAVTIMAEYQLGKTLTDAQTKSIVAWLGSLTGDIPTDYIRQPELPKSTPKTPKPDIGN